MVRIGIAKPCQSSPALPASTLLHQSLPAARYQRTSRRLLFQPLHLFTEMQRPLHRAIDQTLTGLPRSIAAAVSIDATSG
jgi:hypothetical protein